MVYTVDCFSFSRNLIALGILLCSQSMVVDCAFKIAREWEGVKSPRASEGEVLLLSNSRHNAIRVRGTYGMPKKSKEIIESNSTWRKADVDGGCKILINEMMVEQVQGHFDLLTT